MLTVIFKVLFDFQAGGMLTTPVTPGNIRFAPTVSRADQSASDYSPPAVKRPPDAKSSRNPLQTKGIS
jgi:hypothetical protein